MPFFLWKSETLTIIIFNTHTRTTNYVEQKIPYHNEIVNYIVQIFIVTGVIAKDKKVMIKK